MCNDRSVAAQIMVSSDRHTLFGYRAHPNCLELVVGRGGLAEPAAGSSYHLALYDGLIVAPRLIDVLQRGLNDLASIAENPEHGTVQWPHPSALERPRTRRSR